MDPGGTTPDPLVESAWPTATDPTKATPAAADGDAADANSGGEPRYKPADGGVAEDAKSEVVGLRKEITLLNGIGIIVGCMIGSGIFVSPTGIVRQVGSIGAALLVWILCGVYSMLGAYCYAELGLMMQRSGGDYAYVFEVFGPFLGFLRLWAEVMVARPCTLTIVAIVFGEYMIHPLFPTCAKPESVRRLLAAVCILILTFVNCYSVRLSTRVQDICTAIKSTGLALIIITGFYAMAANGTDQLSNLFGGSSTDGGAYAAAFYSGLFAYNGWQFLNCVIEEMKNPKRDLPVSILISCILVTCLYGLANLSYFVTVSWDEIFQSPAVALTMAVRYYGVMWWIMPIIVVFSTFGTVNGILLTTSRIFFVAAEEQQMPSVLKMVQIKRHTPVPSVLFVSFVSLLYLLVGDIFTLINYMGFVNWLAIGISVFIVIWLRFKKPNEPRQIKVNLVVPIIYCLGSLFLVIFSFIGTPTESLYGTIIILSAIPVYLIFVKAKKPKSVDRKLDACYHAVQALFLVRSGAEAKEA